jgi:hypothetical protein
MLLYGTPVACMAKVAKRGLLPVKAGGELDLLLPKLALCSFGPGAHALGAARGSQP